MRLFTILLFLCSQFVFGQYSLLKDINTEPSGSLPIKFSSYEENVFYFARAYETTSFDFWVHNTNTKANQLLLKDVAIWSNISYLQHGKYLLFQANSFDSTIVVNMETLEIDTHNVRYQSISESSDRLMYMNLALNEIDYLEIIDNDINIVPIYDLKSNENFISDLDCFYDGGYYYFICKSNTNSNEYNLYKTDGSNLEVSPFYVSDWLIDGIVSISPTLKVINGQMLFLAIGDSNSYSLWLSDGSEKGTEEVLNLPNTGWLSTGSNFTRFGGELFFRFDYYLVKTDGTISGTEIIDANCGKINYEYNSKVELPLIGDLLIYSGASVAFDYEPSFYNIVTEEKGVIKDIDLAGSSSPVYFRKENGLVFFVANESELWLTNGTTEGTVKVFDLSVNYMNAIYFSGLGGVFNESSGNYYFMGMSNEGDIEPWVVSSTSPESAHELLNINKSEKGSVLSYTSSVLFELNGKVFFTADDGIHGGELWVTDFTEDNTSLFYDLEPGSTGTVFIDAVANDSICYFIAGNSGDYGIWKTDGTVEGTVRFADYTVKHPVATTPGLYLSDDKLFFLNGINLYASDGTAEGTTLLLTESFIYEEIYVAGDKLTFRTSTLEVWITDGTPTGTVKLPRPFLESNIIFAMSSVNEEVFAEYEGSSFNGGNYVTTLHLVKLLKTSGVYSWEEIASHEGVDFISNYKVYPTSWNNSLFYWSNISRDGNSTSFELRLTNGDVEDSKLIKRIQVGDLDEIVNLETSNLFYFICVKNSENELWRSDGTEEGTFKLLDFAETYNLSYQEHNRKLYFSVSHADYGTELWETDGTVVGTKIRVDHLAGEQNSFVSNLLVKGDTLFFSLYDTLSGTEYYPLPLSCDGEVYSVNSGNWHDQDIWSCGEVPKLMDYVIIKSGHKIIQDSGDSTSFKGLETEMGAVVEIKNGSIFKSNAKTN